MDTISKNFENVPIMWQSDGQESVNQKRFKKHIQEKYGAKIDTYWDLHKWSVDHLVEFWAEIWDFAEIICSQKFKKVIDLDVPMSDMPLWFEGAKLNYAENVLRNRDDRVALIMTVVTKQKIREEREKVTATYNEVYEKVRLYAAAFRKLGVKVGDVIAGYISNREEPIYAMLAAVSIGAVWTGALPLIGPEAVLNRFRLVKPKMLITIDRFRNNNVEVQMLPKVKKIAEDLSCLEKVIIVKNNKQCEDDVIKDIRNSCYLDEFLKIGIEKDGSVPPLVFEQLSFSHPVFINYTSGTTGLPKPVVHGCGGFLAVAKDYYVQRVTNKNDTLLSLSPVGWASWNIFVTSMFRGTKLVIYEGTPYFLSPTYIWDLVDEFKLTNLFIAPSVLDIMEKGNYVPTEKHSLESLETFISGTSIVKPNNYNFVYNKVKKDILFTSAYGCTEVFGASLTFDRTLPVYRGEISCPGLAVDLECVNESGKHVVGEIGEIVIKQSSPALPLCLWGDMFHSQFKETYFSKYPGKFCYGDLAIINPVTKGIIVYGRSDETLKPGGWRFGSSEIYNIVNVFPQIQDSLCVSQYNKRRDERVVLFVLVRKGYSFDEELIEKIRSTIKNELSEHHVPAVILETKAIPHNLNGKKMEILVKKIINKMPYNADTVINPASLKNFENVPPYED